MLINKTYNKKFLIGDLHGKWGSIPRHLDTMPSNICYLQVGDFGIGFYDNEMDKLRKLNEFLVEKNSDIYIIRGNHDNPYWFNDDLYDNLKSELTNIFFIPDYTVLNIENENILCIGGAISIDRIPRIKRGIENGTTEYWPDEKIIFDYDKANSYRNIDRMVTHTSPNFAMPWSIGKIVYEFAEKDKSLIKDITTERTKLTDLVNIIMSNNKLKGYYYGHFHNYYTTYVNNCEFICVNVNQFLQF